MNELDVILIKYFVSQAKDIKEHYPNISEAEQAIKQWAKSEFEKMIGDDVELRTFEEHLPNVYHYIKGKNEYRAELRQKLEEWSKE